MNAGPPRSASPPRRPWKAASGEKTGLSGSLVIRLLVTVLAVVALAAGAAGCGPTGPGAGSCMPATETLPASVTSTVIALVPRTSAGDAIWGLDELAQLLAFMARDGLELHVLYTQDSDDLIEGGGDGGPPQAILSDAPAFPAFEFAGAPQRPSDPTSLSKQLYCQRLSAWQVRAGQMVQSELSRREAAGAVWAHAVDRRLAALAGKPIPDTTGTEAGTEADSGASIFSAAQIAAAAPQPTVLFLGGLEALNPPPETFRLPARLIALVRSTNPDQVVPAERSWQRWAEGAGGSFAAVSANAGPALVAQEVAASHG